MPTCPRCHGARKVWPGPVGSPCAVCGDWGRCEHRISWLAADCPVCDGLGVVDSSRARQHRHSHDYTPPPDPATQMVTCPDCDGTGAAAALCLQCGGTGTIPGPRPCPRCVGGLAKWAPHERCRRCNGHGRMEARLWQSQERTGGPPAVALRSLTSRKG
jgi:RecJ-like exonuclease